MKENKEDKNAQFYECGCIDQVLRVSDFHYDEQEKFIDFTLYFYYPFYVKPESFWDRIKAAGRILLKGKDRGNYSFELNYTEAKSMAKWILKKANS